MNKLIPLSVPSIKGNEWKYIKDCLDTEWVSSAGKYVDQFEYNFAKYVGVKSAIACSSGTASLHLASIVSGIKANDEVIVPTVTFIAPINVVKYVGAFPIFMDCDQYLNIDINKIERFLREETIIKDKKCINKKTNRVIKSILIVHVFGHLVYLDKLIKLAEEYNLTVIEDATEALGSYYTKGKYKGFKAGTVGDFGCYSFNGNKIITTGGGGMLVSRSKNDLEKARYLSTQSKDDPVYYVHNEIGFNYRMNNIQAALGVAQLEELDNYIQVKRGNFLNYQKQIKSIDGISFIKEPEYCFSNFWFYSLNIEKEIYGINRDELLKKLQLNNIQTRPVWFLNHLQKHFLNDQNYQIENALKMYNNILSVPCSVNLSNQDIDIIVEMIGR